MPWVPSDRNEPARALLFGPRATVPSGTSNDSGSLLSDSGVAPGDDDAVIGETECPMPGSLFAPLQPLVPAPVDSLRGVCETAASTPHHEWSESLVNRLEQEAQGGALSDTALLADVGPTSRVEGVAEADWALPNRALPRCLRLARVATAASLLRLCRSAASEVWGRIETVRHAAGLARREGLTGSADGDWQVMALRLAGMDGWCGAALPRARLEGDWGFPAWVVDAVRRRKVCPKLAAGKGCALLMRGKSGHVASVDHSPSLCPALLEAAVSRGDFAQTRKQQRQSLARAGRGGAGTGDHREQSPDAVGAAAGDGDGAVRGMTSPATLPPGWARAIVTVASLTRAAAGKDAPTVADAESDSRGGIGRLQRGLWGSLVHCGAESLIRHDGAGSAIHWPFAAPESTRHPNAAETAFVAFLASDPASLNAALSGASLASAAASVAAAAAAAAASAASADGTKSAKAGGEAMSELVANSAKNGGLTAFLGSAGTAGGPGGTTGSAGPRGWMTDAEARRAALHAAKPPPGLLFVPVASAEGHRFDAEAAARRAVGEAEDAVPCAGTVGQAGCLLASEVYSELCLQMSDAWSLVEALSSAEPPAAPAASAAEAATPAVSQPQSNSEERDHGREGRADGSAAIPTAALTQSKDGEKAAELWGSIESGETADEATVAELRR
ncbi:unnamed protein product, partial [Symbiodinium sp. KB8]